MFLNIHEYEKLFAKRQVALHTELVDCNPVLKNRIDTVGEPYGADRRHAIDSIFTLGDCRPACCLPDRLRLEFKDVRASGDIVSRDHTVGIRQAEGNVFL